MPDDNAALDVESPTTNQDVTDTSSVSHNALEGESHTPDFSDGFDMDDVRSGRLSPVEPEPEAKDPKEVDGDKAHEGSVPYERFKEVNEKVGDLTKQVETLVKQGEHMNSQYQQSVNQVRQLQDELRLRSQNPTPEPKSDLAGMTQDDVIAAMEKDAVGFINKLVDERVRGIEGKSKSAADEALARYQATQIYNEYKGKHDDFESMIQDGRIERFQRENPQIAGNVITFHKILSLQNELETLKAGQEQAVKDGVKAEIDRLSKERKAREELDVRPPGGRPTPVKGSSDKELQETAKHGGLTNVLVKRLRSRRGKAA